MNKAAKHLTPTESTTAELCPKCQNLLSVAGMQETDRGWQLVYDCPECNSSFAFVPVMEFRLFEVQGK